MNKLNEDQLFPSLYTEPIAKRPRGGPIPHKQVLPKTPRSLNVRSSSPNSNSGSVPSPSSASLLLLPPPPQVQTTGGPDHDENGIQIEEVGPSS